MSLDNLTSSQDITTLSLMYQLNNVLAEMYKNIILIEEGAEGQVITVNGGSLFQLACQYYGDATLWTVIAQANGLLDPELPAGTALLLTIPQSGTNTGGILNP